MPTTMTTTMRHPFEPVPPDKRKQLFVPLLILTLVAMAVLNVIDRPLQTTAAPNGIISFELAGSVSQTETILDSWGPEARTHAGFSLGFDFLYLVLYSTTIGLACVEVAGAWRQRRPAGAALGIGLAWGQWLAALLDATENGALLLSLLGEPAAPAPQVARWCALAKFALVGLGLVYTLLGVVHRLTTRAISRG